MPVVAVLLALALLGGGAWATTTLGYQPGNAIAPGDAVHGSRDQRVAAEFFDPDMIVRSGSTGDTAAAALEQSAVDARLWSELVPTHVTSIDSPGSFVLTRDDLQTRRASLTRLELRQRMQQLEETLESRGLRPEAFGEFLRGAANLATIPSADAALDGPLGPWIGRYRTTNDDEVAIATLIELPADAGGSVPAIERSDGSRVTVHGPEVAARRDRDEFGDWLGVYSMAQLWLGAFIVWLGTRSFATAIAAAFAALATHSGLLLVMRALGEPAGPHMLPALLLGGSAALVAGARACRAVETGMPTVATGVLVVSLCQIAAGVALLASGEPVWTQTGLWLVVGCALASGTGLFVAPGFADMLRRLRRSAEANR